MFHSHPQLFINVFHCFAVRLLASTSLLEKETRFGSYGKRQTCKSHFSLKLKFPKAKLNRKTNVCNTPRRWESKSNPTYIGSGVCFFPLSSYVYTCYIFGYFLQFQNRNEKCWNRKNVKAHAFSLGLTITIKISVRFHRVDERTNEQTNLTSQPTNRSQSTCVISKISRLEHKKANKDRNKSGMYVR